MLDVYENAQYVQMVMERHGCMDLFEFIDRDPAMDEPLASHIFRQVMTDIRGRGILSTVWAFRH